jgi:hypothetical protein
LKRKYKENPSAIRLGFFLLDTFKLFKYDNKYMVNCSTNVAPKAVVKDIKWLQENGKR